MPFKRSPLQVTLRARADALRSIEVACKRIAALEARLATLDADIAAMGGRLKPEAAPRLPFRASGEMQRAVFELLRERNQITSADLAAVMLARFGLDPSNEVTAYAMRQRCIQALKRCERRGLLLHAGGVGKGGKFKAYKACGSI